MDDDSKILELWYTNVLQLRGVLSYIDRVVGRKK